MATPSLIQAKAPGKIILSGEHAVVAGSSALAMPINRYATTTIAPSSPRTATLHFTNFHKTLLLQPEHKHLSKITKPTELALYTVANALTTLSLPFKSFHMQLASDIPIHRGLGSSAAIIVSLLVTLNHYFKANWSTADILELALEAENKQHGKSSGLDIKTSLLGGCPITNIPLRFVDTGQAQASTSECVLHTQPQFKARPELIQAFSTTTLELQQALSQQDIKKTMHAIQKNHQLLTQIGVVPKKVQHFISEIEKLGMAGKISGAGSIRGDQAGIVLIVGERSITPITKQYGYQTLPLKKVQYGAHVL